MKYSVKDTRQVRDTTADTQSRNAVVTLYGVGLESEISQSGCYLSEYVPIYSLLRINLFSTNVFLLECMYLVTLLTIDDGTRIFAMIFAVSISPSRCIALLYR